MTTKIINPFDLVSFAARDTDSRALAESLSKSQEETAAEVEKKIQEAAIVNVAGAPAPIQATVVQEKADPKDKPKIIKYHYFSLPNDEKKYIEFAQGISSKKYSVAKEIIRELQDNRGSIALHLFVYEMPS